jgi:ubiquitin-conjugating enzyme E2 O
MLQILPSVPASHKFAATPFDVSTAPGRFLKCVQKELRLLRSALPDGIYVKAFEDRLDLFSCMMRGPHDTPYAHCLFVFDVKLPADYPNKPPSVHYR